jgi:hypothetical protein
MMKNFFEKYRLDNSFEKFKVQMLLVVTNNVPFENLRVQ